MSVDAAGLLRAYDEQLRGAAEVEDAVEVDRDGPLYRALFDGGWGFVGYRSLAGYDGPGDGGRLDALIERAVARYADDPRASTFEWKTRGHDLPLDLGARLEARGLVPDELETVMAGEASLLAIGPALPAGVTLRRIGFDADGRPQGPAQVMADVEAAGAMWAEVFGRPDHRTNEAFAREIVERSDHLHVWIAEAGGEIVCAGRLEIVGGTDFAGLWGGATREGWRGRGIYRALTAARARAAVAAGVRYLQVDCSPLSRPILERSGLRAITTTTPYRWTRPA